ncbi:hypothetical protein Avbf_02220 [Armadillidium vulgare]|nr:hypothetical protein Avbf_02220 [Armadillidium vulgare]
MNISKSWGFSNPNQIEGEKLLTYWLCVGLKPYETGENEQIIKIKRKRRPFAITTDIWSSPSHDSFMSITAHWITTDFERKLAVLRCIRYNTTHKASNISYSLKHIFKDWKLNKIHATVRYNAKNIVLAVERAGYQGIGCICYILHLIVKHSIFEQRGIKNDAIKNVCFENLVLKIHMCYYGHMGYTGVLFSVLILDYKTRWGSTITKIERALEQKQGIKLAEHDPELAAESDTASIADVIPLTKKLKYEINEESDAGIGTMKDALLNAIHQYLNAGDRRKHFVHIEENPMTTVATLLDPRREKISLAMYNKDFQTSPEDYMKEWA